MTLSIVTSSCYSSASASSTWSISNYSMPSGVVYLAVSNVFDPPDNRIVTSISHPNLSNPVLVGERTLGGHSGVNKTTLELWRVNGTSGTGTLTIQFSGTVYFRSLFTITASSSVSTSLLNQGKNATTSSGPSLSVTVGATNARYGIAFSHCVVDDNIRFDRWMANSHHLVVGTWHRALLSIENSPSQDIPSQTYTVSSYQGRYMGDSCISVYLFPAASSGGGTGGGGASMLFWELW